jgi:hypothetical protein
MLSGVSLIFAAFFLEQVFNGLLHNEPKRANKQGERVALGKGVFKNPLYPPLRKGERFYFLRRGYFRTPLTPPPDSHFHGNDVMFWGKDVPEERFNRFAEAGTRYNQNPGLLRSRLGS